MRKKDKEEQAKLARKEFHLSLWKVTPEDVGAERFLMFQQQMLDAMEDTRCIGAATCPFHHSPSEQPLVGAAKAPNVKS